MSDKYVPRQMDESQDPVHDEEALAVAVGALDAAHRNAMLVLSNISIGVDRRAHLLTSLRLVRNAARALKRAVGETEMGFRLPSPAEMKTHAKTAEVGVIQDDLTQSMTEGSTRTVVESLTSVLPPKPRKKRAKKAAGEPRR